MPENTIRPPRIDGRETNSAARCSVSGQKVKSDSITMAFTPPSRGLMKIGSPSALCVKDVRIETRPSAPRGLAPRKQYSTPSCCAQNSSKPGSSRSSWYSAADTLMRVVNVMVRTIKSVGVRRTECAEGRSVAVTPCAARAAGARAAEAQGEVRQRVAHSRDWLAASVPSPVPTAADLSGCPILAILARRISAPRAATRTGPARGLAIDTRMRRNPGSRELYPEARRPYTPR